MQQQKQRIVPQKNCYHLNLISWIVMGCGIARFDQRGLKTTKTWTFWSHSLSPCDLEGCHTLDLEGRRYGTSTSVRHPSRSQGTNFETKTFMFWWVLGPSEFRPKRATQNMGLTSNLDLNFFVHILPFHPRPVVPSLKSLQIFHTGSEAGLRPESEEIFETSLCFGFLLGEPLQQTLHL